MAPAKQHPCHPSAWLDWIKLIVLVVMRLVLTVAPLVVILAAFWLSSASAADPASFSSSTLEQPLLLSIYDQTFPAPKGSGWIASVDDADQKAIEGAAQAAGGLAWRDGYHGCAETAYGELRLASVAVALRRGLRVANVAAAKATVLDLGSGRGATLAVAAAELGVAEALGVELSAVRHGAACAKLRELRAARLQPPGGASGGRILLKHGDMLKAKSMISRADVVFTTATCFRAPLLATLFRTLLHAAARRKRSIVLVMTSVSCKRATRNLLSEGQQRRVRPVEDMTLAASWISDARVYVCEVLPGEEGPAVEVAVEEGEEEGREPSCEIRLGAAKAREL